MYRLLLIFALTLCTAELVSAKNKLEIGFLTFDGLHVAADGTMYAADGTDGTNVYKINESGVVEVYATGLDGPVDIATDSLGNLFVTNFHSNVVTKIEPDRTKSVFAQTDIGPSGIYADELDNIYVAHYGPLAGGGSTILKVSPNGDVTTFAEGGLLDSPIGLTMDDLGNIITANFNNGNVIKITPEGIQSLIAHIPSPYGYAIGHLEFVKNRIFATGLIDQKIYVIRKNGKVKTRDIVAPGEYPNGIAFDAVRSQVIFTNTFAPSFGIDRIKIK